MERYLLAWFFIFVSLPAFSQKDIAFNKDNFKDKKEEFKVARKNLSAGDEIFSKPKSLLDQEYRKAFFRNAIPYYSKAYALNPDNAELNYKLGVCYLFSEFKPKSLPYLEKAQKLNPAIAKDLGFYLGRSYHLNLEWEKATAAYTAFLKNLNGDEAQEIAAIVKKHLKECQTGQELQRNPQRVFIDNLGPSVNTKYPEYGPVISADESVMVFTSRRPSTTGGARDEEENMYYEDLFISHKVNGVWGPAKNMGPSINTAQHDAVVCLSPDGQKMIIYRDENYGDLYECTLQGEEWSTPKRLNKNINTKYHESSASYSYDGNTLYFVSDKPDGYGQHDIYIAKRDEKGEWGKAVNAGPVLNTPYDEEGVFMLPDGKTLYFSSQGHSSMGGFDVFKSVFKNGQWSTPENLGYPINTPDDDVFLVLSASQRYGYYASAKGEEGQGSNDIYKIFFLGPEKPMVLTGEDNLLASLTLPVAQPVIAPQVDLPVAQSTLLKGVVLDAATKKVLEASIDLIDNSKNEIIATFTSNSATGKYLVSLPSGKNYGIAVKKEGYLFHSENFDIPASSAFQEVRKDVELKGISIGNKIVLKNIFFDFDKATLRPESANELERLTKLLQEMPSLKIEISGHTDNKGSATYNQTLSKNRAKAVVDYLATKGIATNRLQFKGYGLEQPMVANDTEENRQLNRRTEFKILSK